MTRRLLSMGMTSSHNVWSGAWSGDYKSVEYGEVTSVWGGVGGGLLEVTAPGQEFREITTNLWNMGR